MLKILGAALQAERRRERPVWVTVFVTDIHG
jgi:hypothetical protein